MASVPNPHGYPYRDGDVTVIGPEAIMSEDEGVISYKGEHFVSHGRHTADDTARRWFLRVFATIGVLAAGFAAVALFLFIIGVKAVF